MKTEDIFVTSRQMRSIDKKATEDYKIPAETLMENAGKAVALEIIKILNGVLSDLKCVIACGTGNNGGDGLVAARYLAGEKIKPEVFIPYSKKGYNKLVSSNLKKLSDFGVTADNFDNFEQSVKKTDFIVDALLGTGAKGAPRGQLAQVIDMINSAQKKVFAIDIPTGLDADTGKSHQPCIKADYTFTLGFNKKGFLNSDCKKYTGKIKVLDIGFPAELIKSLTTQSQ